MFSSANQSPTKVSNEAAIAVPANEATITQDPTPTQNRSMAASLKRNMTRNRKDCRLLMTMSLSVCLVVRDARNARIAARVCIK